MKLSLSSFLLLFCILALFSQDTSAQAKRKSTSAKKSSKKVTSKNTNSQLLDANLAVAKADTAKIPAAPAPRKDPYGFESAKVISMRPDRAIGIDSNRIRMPLEYDYIREDDAFYRERVWREIDVREKMNLTFTYRATEDSGSLQFINILLKAITTKQEISGREPITAFSTLGGTDDRFTTPMSISEVDSAVVGPSYMLSVTDPVTGVQSDVRVTPEFNPDAIIKYRLKEEWIFDKETSRMVVRILGIAPIIEINVAGIMQESPLFWVYYPDLRPLLATYDVYNGKNYGAKMSWEELFESRYFASNIIKSTIENPRDLFLKQMDPFKTDLILRLYEGENIKNKIFNFEQDLWSY